MDRAAVVCKRISCDFPSGMSGMSLEEGLEGEVVDCREMRVSIGVRVHASVPSALVSLLNLKCEVDLSSVSFSDCEIVVSFSRKRGASFVLECAYSTRERMQVPKRTSVKALPECLKNRAPPPSRVTPVQRKTTWHRSPSDPPPEELAEEEPQRWHKSTVAVEVKVLMLRLPNWNCSCPGDPHLVLCGKCVRRRWTKEVRSAGDKSEAWVWWR